MGGSLTVSSQEDHGSTFRFILPYKVSSGLDDANELSDAGNDAPEDADHDLSSGFFQFQPHPLGSLLSSRGSNMIQKLLSNNIALNTSHKLNRLMDDSYSFPSSNITSKEVNSLEECLFDC